MTILMSFQAVALGEAIETAAERYAIGVRFMNAKRTLRVLAPLPSRLARQEPLLGISAQPIGQQAAVMALPWPVPPWRAGRHWSLLWRWPLRWGRFSSRRDGAWPYRRQRRQRFRWRCRGPNQRKTEA